MPYENHYLKTYFLSEFEAKWKYTSLSSFDARTNVQKMAPLCRILILWQTKLKENGFHSLTRLQISFHTM